MNLFFLCYIIYSADDFFLSVTDLCSFPGWISDGEFGRTARVAASDHDRSEGEQPKYLQEAASSPTTFPPNGALEE